MKTLYHCILMFIAALAGMNSADGQCNFGTVIGTSGSATYIGSGSHRNVLCPGDSVFNYANTGSNTAYLDSGSYYLISGSGGSNIFYVKRHATLDISGTGTADIIRYDTGAIILNTLTTGATLQACNNLQFNAQPSINPIGGPSAVCVGSAISLTNATTGGTWNASNGTATVNASGSVTGVADGTDTIYYTASNTCGTATVSKIITIQSPNPVITGLDTVCVGGSISLAINSNSGIWNSSNTTASITSSTIFSAAVMGVSAGQDTIRYSGTNACGAFTALLVITVTSQPHAAAIGGLTTVCVGSSLQLSEAVSGGVWLSSNHSAFVSGGLVAGVSAGTDTILYVLSNSFGADTAKKIITVMPLPVVSPITGANTVCTGCNITLTDTTTGGVWASSNARATVSGGIVTGVTAGRDTITYRVTNSCGVATSSMVITVQAPVNLGTLIGKDHVCIGSAITITDTATGLPLAGRTWTASNGAATLNPVGLMLTCRVTGVYAGKDTISFTINGPNGPLTVTKVIMVDTLPTPVITLSGNILTATGTYATYQWQMDTTSIPGATGLSFVVSTKGNYRVIVTDANGCSGISNSISFGGAGVNNINNPTDIRVYPNPAQDAIYISSPGRVNTQLTSIEGRVLLTQNSTTKVDVHTLATGVYLLDISDTESGLKLKTERIVVSR